MTAASIDGNFVLDGNDKSEFARNFQGRPATAQIVESARDEWKDHLKHVWGGAGSWIHNGASWLQKALVPVIAGSAVSLAIPVVGELIEGSELLVYAFASAIKGLVRTSAENHAITAAGGTEKDHGGVARHAGNILKSSVPFFDV